MKNYFKGLLTGVLGTIIVLSISVFAQNIQATFNGIAVNVNGAVKSSWDDNYVRDENTSVPMSISYEDTTYLPMRKIAELCNKDIHWNGDTKTIYLMDKNFFKTSQFEKIITEKPDVYGNIWTYYTFTSDNGVSYLGVTDKERDYTRLYKLIGSAPLDDRLKVTDDAIYFVKEYTYRVAVICKLSFLNDINTQDGEVIRQISTESGPVLFHGDYIFYQTQTYGNADHGVLNALNLITRQIAIYSDFSVWESMTDITVKNETEDSMVISGKLRKAQCPFEITLHIEDELRFDKYIEIRE